MSAIIKRGNDLDYWAVIKEVGRGANGARALSTVDAESLFGAMLDGRVPDLELGAIDLAYPSGLFDRDQAGAFFSLAILTMARGRSQLEMLR